MKKIVATIGEGQFSKRQIRSLQALITHHYKTCLQVATVRVFWHKVPQTHLFRNYKNGQPSILMIECDPNLPQQRRVDMFKACTSDWLRMTGQGIDQLIIAILESPAFNVLLKGNSQFFNTMGRLKYFTRQGVEHAFSRVTMGYYSFKPSC